MTDSITTNWHSLFTPDIFNVCDVFVKYIFV